MVDTPELTLTPPMKPGVNHPQHTEGVKQAVAKHAGVEVVEVTPPDEIAEKIINDAQTSFLKSIADVGSESVRPRKSEFGEPGDFMETVKAFIPGGDGNSTVRTGSSKEPYNLEAKRKEKMNPPKEAT